MSPRGAGRDLSRKGFCDRGASEERCTRRLQLRVLHGGRNITQVLRRQPHMSTTRTKRWRLLRRRSRVNAAVRSSHEFDVRSGVVKNAHRFRARHVEPSYAVRVVTLFLSGGLWRMSPPHDVRSLSTIAVTHLAAVHVVDGTRRHGVHAEHVFGRWRNDQSDGLRINQPQVPMTSALTQARPAYLRHVPCIRGSLMHIDRRHVLTMRRVSLQWRCL